MRWLLAFVLVCGVSVVAEDCLTEGVDHGRTGWMKNERLFTTANVGSMKLLRGGREIVAAATRDAIYLLDAASLGGANHSTPLLLVPGPRGIAAVKIVDEGGRPSLQPGWTSRDLAAPTSPIIVNDVVFTASSGRPRGLAYTFDSRSGRELWNSGKPMTSYVPPGNLWASNSQVHVGTHDGTVYAFGYSLERR